MAAPLREHFISEPRDAIGFGNERKEVGTRRPDDDSGFGRKLRDAEPDGSIDSSCVSKQFDPGT